MLHRPMASISRNAEHHGDHEGDLPAPPTTGHGGGHVPVRQCGPNRARCIPDRHRVLGERGRRVGGQGQRGRAPRRSALRRGARTHTFHTGQATFRVVEAHQDLGKVADGRGRVRNASRPRMMSAPDLGWHPHRGGAEGPGLVPDRRQPQRPGLLGRPGLDRPAALDCRQGLGRGGCRATPAPEVASGPAAAPDSRPIPTRPARTASRRPHRRRSISACCSLIISGIALMFGSVGSWVNVTGSRRHRRLPCVHQRHRPGDLAPDQRQRIRHLHRWDRAAGDLRRASR